MILRSMLYVPGNNIKLISKALNLSMDAVILDLEDAVPMQAKEEARNNIKEQMGNFKKAGLAVFVRVNSFGTNLTNDDLKVVVDKDLDGIILAKTETDEEISGVDAMLKEHETRSGLEIGQVKIAPLIESARGVMHVYAIAKSNPRIEAVAFGAGDYLRDLDLDIASVSQDQGELLYARSQIVNSCKALGINPIDTPYLLSLKDKERFMNEVTIAHKLGFSGKQCIHPDQIAPVNQAFSPSEEKVAYSLRLVEAFDEAEREGLGAVSFEGKMIDRMSYAQAKQLLSRKMEISEREKH
jgi:citrate lyase subunit beta/citryl-CoA lyase